MPRNMVKAGDHVQARQQDGQHKDAWTQDALILGLPVELLHLIFEHLDCLSVSSMRRTCSLLAQIGEDHFHTIQTDLKRARLQGLKTLATYPGLLKPVKAFHFQADKLKYPWLPPLNYALWIDSCGFRQPWTECSRTYDTYKAAVADQQAIFESKFDLECLTQIFSQCPSLENITVSTGHATEEHVDPIQPALKDATISPYGDGNPHQRGVHQFWTVIEALHHAQRKPKRFLAERVGPLILQSFWKLTPTRTLMANLMADMRCFRIGFSYSNYSRPFGGERWIVLQDRTGRGRSYDREALGKWLSTASQLRVLKIGMPHENEWGPLAALEYSIGSTTWPKLRELGLKNFHAREDFLVSLLLRHRDSLRYLSMSGICFYEGEWEAVFKRIAGKLPKLCEMKLRGKFCNEGLGMDRQDEFFDFGDAPAYANAMEQFVLQGGIFPDAANIASRFDEGCIENAFLVAVQERSGRSEEPGATYTMDDSEADDDSDDFDAGF